MNIPGHFFALGSAVATLDTNGRIGVALKPGQNVGLRIDGLSPATWEARLESDNEAQMELADGQVMLSAGQRGVHARWIKVSRRVGDVNVP